MHDCITPPSRKQNQPNTRQVKFQVADPQARLSQGAIEAIARLLLSVPDEVRSEQPHAIAA